MSIKDGANYAPQSGYQPVVEPGAFRFAAAFLDHGHIYGQVAGLLAAGGTLEGVYDPDPQRVAEFVKRFPDTKVWESFDDLLTLDTLHLIASAAVPSERAGVGLKVLQAGKHNFTDKSPFTTLEQLAQVEAACAQTGQRYFVYYAERLHNEAAWRTGELIANGAIGRVLQVVNLAPHRLNKVARPAWFFDKNAYGGILTDIGSHQVEQFLTYAGCADATVNFARVENYSHPDKPGLEDFGEMSMTGDNGASFYARVDWYTPEGMPVWGDGRTFIVGTQGTLEVRKYIDLGRSAPASVILQVNGESVETINCAGAVGFPFFGQLILDVLNGTDTAMSQAHIFKAAELSMRAQQMADEARSRN